MRSRVVLVAVALALLADAAQSATYKGRQVDGHWFEGRVENDDFGAYDCQVRFSGDRAMIRLLNYNLQLEGFLDEEDIGDPHRVRLHDPKRGMYWTLDVFNFGE